MVIRPEDESDVPQEIQDHITDDDSYGEYNKKYDATTYLVAEGRRLAESFLQSELERMHELCFDAFIIPSRGPR